MKQEHINEIKAIVILVVGLILLASFISYTPQDLSWRTSTPNVPPHNFIGIVGAYLSENWFLEESSGAKIIYDIRSSRAVPEAVESAAKLYSPNVLCTYLYDLAQKYNSFYNKDKIIGSEKEEFRLALTSGVGQTLKNGLKLLGIEAPEKM